MDKKYVNCNYCGDMISIDEVYEVIDSISCCIECVETEVEYLDAYLEDKYGTGD